MKGVTIWFTGFSGSGKTTIANSIKQKLAEESITVIVLDGDVVRQSLSRDLGYSKEERDRHITRVADVCKLITEQGGIVIACVISPTRKIREYARKATGNFIEVNVKCPLSVCEQRDPKDHYKRVRASQNTEDFVGITIPYEEPENPEVVVDTDKSTIEECTEKIITYLKNYLYEERHG